MKVRHCQPGRFRSATTYLCFSSPHSGPNLSGWGHFLFASRSFAFPAWMSSLLARIGQAHDGRIGRSIESLACASTRYRSRRREIQQAPVFIDARFKGIEFPTKIKRVRGRASASHSRSRMSPRSLRPVARAGVQPRAECNSKRIRNFPVFAGRNFQGRIR